MVKTILIICSIANYNFQYRITPDRIEMYLIGNDDNLSFTYQSKILDFATNKVFFFTDHNNFDIELYEESIGHWAAEYNHSFLKSNTIKDSIKRDKCEIITSYLDKKYLSFLKPFYNDTNLDTPFIFERKIGKMNTLVTKIHSITFVNQTKDNTNNDDLKCISGIDGFINQKLKDIGISTFNELYNMDTDHIRNFSKDYFISVEDIKNWQYEASMIIEKDFERLVLCQNQYYKNLK